MSEYNAESIKVVSDIEHVRLRTNLYIGDADNPNHLFSEIFDNALDESISGYSNDPIVIDVFRDNNSYRITDFGRGLPQGLKKLDNGTSESVIKLLFTKLNSGGKFDGENYRISSGLHGQGQGVVNALSKSLKVYSIRDHIEYHEFERGNEIKSEIYELSKNDKRGTAVEFIPDNEIFEDNKISTDFLINRCKIASAFGVKSKLYIHENDKSVLINTDADIYSMIQEDSDIRSYLKFNDRIEDKETGEYFVYAIDYTNDTSCKTKSYTNLLPNTQGGTHVRIMERALEDAWNRFKIDGVLPKDYYLGLRFVVAAFISETSFSSQTKERLTTDKKYLERFVKPISDSIYNNLKENEDIRKGIIRRFQEHRSSQNKLLAKKEIKDLIILNKDTNGYVRRKSVMSKLCECTSKSRKNTELHICEGDSAAGPLISNRNIVTQAILPIRGKILNVSRFMSDLVKSLSNEEVRSIVNAAGTGILEECDVSRSRYERYILDTDADPDGKQIASLVVSIFVNLLPNVVKSGMLYVSVPPLYGWYEGNEFKFGNDRNEIPKGSHFERFKGLGQMNPNEITDTLLNEEKRTLMRINYPDSIDQFNNILTSPSTKYDILYSMGLIKYID